MTQSEPTQPRYLDKPFNDLIIPGKTKQRWRFNLLLLVIVGLSSTGITTVYSSILARQHPDSSALSSGETNIPEGVSALGYLEPQGETIKLSAPAFIEGARVTQLLVKRGERVKIGQVIAILDSHDRLQAALEQAKTQVQVAQANLDKVQAGAKQGEIKAQNARFIGTQAELQGQIALQQATISNLQAQLLGERNAQEANIEGLNAELRNKTTECQRYQTLHQDGAVSAQEYDRICLQQEITQKELKEAKANLNRIVSTLQDQINSARANLSRTIATLQIKLSENQAMLEAVTEIRPVDIQVAQSQLASSQAALKQAQANLDLAYVRSPRNGQILAIHTWPGEMVNTEGIVELGQTQQMYVRAEVYESDIMRVRPGQIAVITPNGFVGELKGVVEEIGLKIDKQKVLGTDPSVDVDARVVDVKIRLNPKDSQRVAQLTNLQVNVVLQPSQQ